MWFSFFKRAGAVRLTASALAPCGGGVAEVANLARKPSEPADVGKCGGPQPLCGVFALAALEKLFPAWKVTSDLSSYEETNVLRFWPTLDADIVSAIAAKLNVADQAQALQILVEIDKLSFDGDTVLRNSGEFNTLDGTVTNHEGKTISLRFPRGKPGMRSSADTLYQ